jgi:hypothetical protein
MTKYRNSLEVVLSFFDSFSEDLRDHLSFLILNMDIRSESESHDVFQSDVKHSEMLRRKFDPDARLPGGVTGRVLALRTYLDHEMKRMASDEQTHRMRTWLNGDKPTPGIDRVAHLERFERWRDELISKRPEWHRLLENELSDAGIEQFAVQQMIENHDEMKSRIPTLDLTGGKAAIRAHPVQSGSYPAALK